jgi:hypothetical protein
MKRWIAIAALIIGLTTWVVPADLLAQRRGGSFGGSRGGGYGRSFGRSYGGGSRSFGGSRTSPNRPNAPSQRGTGYSAPAPKNSFGGSRMSRPADYTGRYGVPRSTERRSMPGANGTQNNYVVNRYGGMGDGFMMGSIPWYWSMPFHPAYYYSRPHTVVNPDGTTGVYPGTFQWGSLFMTLLVIGAIGFVIYIWLKNKRRRLSYAQAYDSDDDARKSSFM